MPKTKLSVLSHRVLFAALSAVEITPSGNQAQDTMARAMLAGILSDVEEAKYSHTERHGIQRVVEFTPHTLDIVASLLSQLVESPDTAITSELPVGWDGIIAYHIVSVLSELDRDIAVPEWVSDSMECVITEEAQDAGTMGEQLEGEQNAEPTRRRRTANVGTAVGHSGEGTGATNSEGENTEN